MRYLFIFILCIHSVIHFVGFATQFGIFKINELSLNISYASGIAWLIASFLFIATAFLVKVNNKWWWIIPLFGIALSQSLIIKYWSLAQYGTYVNILILIALTFGFFRWIFFRNYHIQVLKNINKLSLYNSFLEESDIIHLPNPVKKYIRNSGAIGKPKVQYFKAKFSGVIRKNESSPWMPFTSEQYNFLDQTLRLFFMKAKMFHLPVAGFHSYSNGYAFMDIRLFSIFKVQYQTGNVMSIAETVTFFNDMCCLAPGTLIDNRIKWTELENNTVRASFTVNDICISATLYFNNKGELLNFISDDRYANLGKNIMKKFTWSTPLKNPKDFNGHMLNSYAETNYLYPEGNFTYGKFNLNTISYNEQ